ncbi:class A beta-lactamase-related serine hydrolase [Streptomyces kunmingensis]|uniref:Class A beta-lactamase-related serine hydrolase n=1 Tax=Streptomyces kunmingensis TaxID=68225 RepID=A0ABU6CES2_9ACTN|nr:serine hydrolase [Streptomyces kunmingensis]MEB3963202.1 class A beta-lactamase-related serine hydrolase [Streptomyces kunmingensis]
MSAAAPDRAIRRTLRAMFDDAGVRGLLHVAEVHRPTAAVTLDADEAVLMGSLYKVPLMVAYCRQVDAGVLDPLQRITLTPKDRLPGPTGISQLRDEVSMSLRDLVVMMMAISDNAAADAVLRHVGAEAFDDTCRALGLLRTRLNNGAAGTFDRLMELTGAASVDAAMARIADNDQAAPPGVYDPSWVASTTPAEMARLLRGIWTDTAASPAGCAFIRRTMQLQPWRHRLAAGFPYDDVAVYGKTATFGAMRHEAGMVRFADGHTYTAVVLTQAARADRSLPRADAVIGAAARRAVEYLRGDA